MSFYDLIEEEQIKAMEAIYASLEYELEKENNNNENDEFN
jgi:hypothetical protein